MSLLSLRLNIQHTEIKHTLKVQLLIAQRNKMTNKPWNMTYHVALSVSDGARPGAKMGASVPCPANAKKVEIPLNTQLWLVIETTQTPIYIPSVVLTSLPFKKQRLTQWNDLIWLWHWRCEKNTDCQASGRTGDTPGGYPEVKCEYFIPVIWQASSVDPFLFNSTKKDNGALGNIVRRLLSNVLN